MKKSSLSILSLLLLFLLGNTIPAQTKYTSVKENRQLIQKGQYYEACSNLEYRVSKKPNDFQAWLWLGIARYHTGKTKEAIHALDQALLKKLSPDDRCLAYNYLGSAYFRLNDWDNSIAYYSRSLFLKPKELATLISRGTALMWSGNYEGALFDFNTALSHHPQNPDALIGKGQVLINQKSFEEALQLFNSLIPRLSDQEVNYRTHTIWGKSRSLYGLGQFEMAHNAIQEALSIISKDDYYTYQQLLILQAFCTLAIGNDHEAFAILSKAEKITASSYALDFEKSLLHFLKGDQIKAADLRGGKGSLGVEFYVRDGTVFVGKTYGEESTTATTLQKNDILLKIRDIPISDIAQCIDLINSQIPGSSVEVEIERDGIRQKLELIVQDYKTYLPEYELAFPFTQKQNYQEKQGGILISDLDIDYGDSKPTDVSGAGDLSLFELEDGPKAELEIDALLIEPSPVTADNEFSIIVELFVYIPTVSAKTLKVQMDYEISYENEVITQFPVREFVVNNNDYSTLIRKPKAGQKPGQYTLEVALSYQDQKSSKKIDFEIQ